MMSEVMRWKLKGFIPGVEGESKAVFQPTVVLAEDYDSAARLFLDAAERCLAAERREQALLNSIETANADLAALREELKREQRYVEINANSAHGKHKEGQRYRDERDALREELAEFKRVYIASTGREVELNKRLADAERRNAELLAMLHMAKELLSTISLHRTMAPNDWCDSFKAEMADRLEKLRTATQPTVSGASEDKCSDCFGTGHAYSNGMPIGGTCDTCKGAGHDQ